MKKIFNHRYLGWYMLFALGTVCIILSAIAPSGMALAIFLASALGFTCVYFFTDEVNQNLFTALRSKVNSKIISVRDKNYVPIIENRYDQEDVIDALPVASILISSKGLIQRSNAAAKRLLNIAEDEHPQFGDILTSLGPSINGIFEDERIDQYASKPIMFKASRSDVELFLQVSLSRIQTKIGNCTIAVLSDATEMKTLELQFVQSQKMQAIGQLAGGVAHDFNNLLTAISGYCDLLKLRHEKGDPNYSDLVQIENNANRAATLVGQLLAFSRKQTLQPKAVQVNDTLTDLTHLLNRLVGEKITLRLDQARSLPLAFVDSRQLEQVIMNLVVNARDAMKDGGSIWIRTKSVFYETDQQREKVQIFAGQYVHIEVMDEGTGINKDDLTKVFEPFFSTKKVGEGTGLGLSMAYGIVKQTGGYIFADSELDKGTTFSIFLPIASKTAVESDKAQPTMISKPKGLTGLKVMLVEDEDPVRTFASRALSMQGIDIIQARSGEEALELAKENANSIDVIISDVIMPGMNGPEWVTKAQDYCSECKVIFMSGYAEEVFDNEASFTRDYKFLPKPFSLKGLIEAVSDIVEYEVD